MSRPSWLRSRGRFALLTAIALALDSCALISSHYLAADAPKSSDFGRVVLLPMNYDSSPRPEFAAGVEQVGEQMRRFLEASGYEVIMPRMSDTLVLWKASSEEVGGILQLDGKSLDEERYESARSDLVRRMLDSFPADGVVSGSVMVREGRYRGLTLRWDGVTRPVPVNKERSVRSGFNIRGKAEGTSLRTTVFDRVGNRIFERYVGLEPLDGFKMGNLGYEVRRRKDLFLDEALLLEAIAISFQPWLVQPSKPE